MPYIRFSKIPNNSSKKISQQLSLPKSQLSKKQIKNLSSQKPRFRLEIKKRFDGSLALIAISLSLLTAKGAEGAETILTTFNGNGDQAKAALPDGASTIFIGKNNNGAQFHRVDNLGQGQSTHTMGPTGTQFNGGCANNDNTKKMAVGQYPNGGNTQSLSTQFHYTNHTNLVIDNIFTGGNTTFTSSVACVFKNDNGYFIFGDMNVGNQDGFIAHYAPNHTLFGTIFLGGVSSIENASAMCIDSNGNIYVTLKTTLGTNPANTLLMKLDSNGVMQEAKIINSGGNDDMISWMQEIAPGKIGFGGYKNVGSNKVGVVGAFDTATLTETFHTVLGSTGQTQILAGTLSQNANYIITVGFSDTIPGQTLTNGVAGVITVHSATTGAMTSAFMIKLPPGQYTNNNFRATAVHQTNNQVIVEFYTTEGILGYTSLDFNPTSGILSSAQCGGIIEVINPVTNTGNFSFTTTAIGTVSRTGFHPSQSTSLSLLNSLKAQNGICPQPYVTTGEQTTQAQTTKEQTTQQQTTQAQTTKEQTTQQQTTHQQSTQFETTQIVNPNISTTSNFPFSTQQQSLVTTGQNPFLTTHEMTTNNIPVLSSNRANSNSTLWISILVSLLAAGLFIALLAWVIKKVRNKNNKKTRKIEHIELENSTPYIGGSKKQFTSFEFTTLEGQPLLVENKIHKFQSIPKPPEEICKQIENQSGSAIPLIPDQTQRAGEGAFGYLRFAGEAININNTTHKFIRIVKKSKTVIEAYDFIENFLKQKDIKNLDVLNKTETEELKRSLALHLQQLLDQQQSSVVKASQKTRQINNYIKNPSLAFKDYRKFKSLFHEWQIYNTLKNHHNNIVEFRGGHNGSDGSGEFKAIYLVLELLWGNSEHFLSRLHLYKAHLLNEGKKLPTEINNLLEDIIIHFALQTLSGIKFLHENGIYHLDLKLDNILMSQDGIAKIADLGESHSSATNIICAKGGANAIKSPAFIAATKNREAGKTDQSIYYRGDAADLWAWASMIYRLAYNELLFPITNPNPNDKRVLNAWQIIDEYWNAEFLNKHLTYGVTKLEKDFPRLSKILKSVLVIDEKNCPEVKTVFKELTQIDKSNSFRQENQYKDFFKDFLKNTDPLNNKPKPTSDMIAPNPNAFFSSSFPSALEQKRFIESSYKNKAKEEDSYQTGQNESQSNSKADAYNNGSKEDNTQPPQPTFYQV